MAPTSASIYVDHAATTPLRPEARDAMEPFLNGDFGNPSGLHATSRRAKAALEEARERAAMALGAEHPLDVVFTGGGTESDNLGVAGPVLGTGRGVVTTAIEHEAVLETSRFLARLGHDVDMVGVDVSGIVDPAEVAARVGATTGVVSVMLANNEVGSRQPVAEVTAVARDANPDVLVHTDAVQALVSEEVTLESTSVDLLTLASHKFGGPKGVGLLHARRVVPLEPVLHGGGQELGRRSGTHNVAGIVGMVTALEAAIKDRERFRADVGAARDGFESELARSVPDVVFTIERKQRLVQHSHFRIPGIDAETLLIRLDALGVAGSAGSACHSGALEVSHVLDAMNISAGHAAESVRFSFGWTTRPEEGPDAARAVAEVVEALR